MKCGKCGKQFKHVVYHIAPPFGEVCKPCYDATPIPQGNKK